MRLSMGWDVGGSYYNSKGVNITVGVGWGVRGKIECIQHRHTQTHTHTHTHTHTPVSYTHLTLPTRR